MPKDTFDVIRTILAVRSFQDRPIPDEIVHQIVEAGHLTASSMNGQPWHFIVVRDKDTLRKLGEIAHTGRYIPQAPMASSSPSPTARSVSRMLAVPSSP
jgi:nitroreductase